MTEQEIRDKIWEAYKTGVMDGVRKYAWWKDGTQYVGTTGRTLKVALEELEKYEKDH